MSSADIPSLNRALVNQLKSYGVIRTARVEEAFLAVPRHLFVPGVDLERVYRDQVIITKQAENGEPISSSSQPAIVAILLEQLRLEPGQRVLEIGAGTGQTAALIAYLVGESGHVVTVDIDPELVASAREHLAAAGFDRVQVVCADGWAGYPDAAPYDRILLTVGAFDIAPAWREQLKPNGRIVLPLGLRGVVQKAVAFEPADGYLTSISIQECGFMSMRGDSAPRPKRSGILLGPEPGLSIGVEGQRTLDAASIYGWLTGPAHDVATNVRLHRSEIWSGLRFWLALREPDLCFLNAADEMVDRGIVPCLFGFDDGKTKSCFTGGILGAAGLGLLLPPPGQDFAAAERQPVPFDLLVRSYGPDETPAQRLVEQVKTWDVAGRPSGKGLRIRAYPAGTGPYPAGTEYLAAENEIVVDKPSTRLVLDWPSRNS